MKRTIFLLAVLFLCVGVALLFVLGSLRRNVPRFAPAAAPASMQMVHYDFMGPRPFEYGVMWIVCRTNSTNGVNFIYDIEKRRVLGRVQNAWPEMILGTPDRLLCSQATPATPVQQLKAVLLKLLAATSKGPSRARAAAEGQIFWLLDTSKNAATRIGKIPGTPNFTLSPSPDFHYCFTGRDEGPGMQWYLMDLEAPRIEKINLPGFACGWWDSTRLLVEATNTDLVLCDVRDNKTTLLVSGAMIRSVLETNGIVSGQGQAHPFGIWNGHETQVYLTDTHQRWLATNSFLIKLERPDGRLKVISPRFKFEWSDHLDPTGRWYLYSGRQAGQASDAVFLRDLDTGTERVLVASESNKYFSIPRFYRDSAIYVRSNALWQISLSGSNNVRLFPP